MPLPPWWGHNALTAVVCLSICLSVPCLAISQEQNGVEAENWQERSPQPHLEVRRSTAKVTRLLNAMTDNKQCLQIGTAYELHTWHTD